MYIGVPGDESRLRDAGVVGRAGQAEVGDLDVLDAVFQQDVARLDVAVDQAHRVGGGQAGGDLPADPQHVRQLERAGRGRASAASVSPGDVTP